MSYTKKIGIALMLDIIGWLELVNFPYSGFQGFENVCILAFTAGIPLLSVLLIISLILDKRNVRPDNNQRSNQEYNQSVKSYNNQVDYYNNSANPWMGPVDQYPQAKSGSKVTTTYEKNVQNSSGAADLKVQNSTNPNGSTKHESRFVGRTIQNGRVKHTIQHTVTTTGNVSGQNRGNQLNDYYLNKQGQRVPLHHVNVNDNAHSYNAPQSRNKAVQQSLSQNGHQALDYTNNNSYPVYQPRDGELRK